MSLQFCAKYFLAKSRRRKVSNFSSAFICGICGKKSPVDGADLRRKFRFILCDHRVFTFRISAFKFFLFSKPPRTLRLTQEGTKNIASYLRLSAKSAGEKLLIDLLMLV